VEGRVGGKKEEIIKQARRCVGLTKFVRCLRSRIASGFTSGYTPLLKNPTVQNTNTEINVGTKIH